MLGGVDGRRWSVEGVWVVEADATVGSVRVVAVGVVGVAGVVEVVGVVGVVGVAECIAGTYIRHNDSHTEAWIGLAGMLAEAVDR